MSLKLLLASIVTGGILLACTTDPAGDRVPTGPVAQDTVNYILSKTWKLTAITASPGVVYQGSTITDIYASDILSDCDKHQKRQYNANNTITFTNDSASCGLASGTYTWSVSGNVLTTTAPDTGTAVKIRTNTIVSIDSTQMVLKWNVPASDSPDNAAHVATETYTAQ